MNRHFEQVTAALGALKPGAIRGDESALAEVRRAAEEANRIRFREQLRRRGEAQPFREDGRSRERRVADIRRFARLAAQAHGRAPQPGGPKPFPMPLPAPGASPCEPGWSPVLREGDVPFRLHSAPVDVPAQQMLSPAQNGGYSGISALASADTDELSIGAAIGEFCDIVFTPPDQQVTMGSYQGAAISVSASTVFDLASPLSTRAPDALMARASLLRTQATDYLVAGDPAGPGGGFVWCYATAVLDLYVGGTPLHGQAEACLWNRMGSPLPPDPNLDNGVNGDWLTRVDVFDDGDVSNPTLVASIGGTGVASRVLMAVVSVNVACLRYPKESGFSGVLFAAPGSQLVSGPDVQPTQTSPILLQGLSLCGI